MRRILFFTCEPGGAEVLIPVIRMVQAQPRWEAVILGYGHALERFVKKKINCNEIGPVQMENFSLLDHHAPDLLITSATSLPAVDMSEKYLWRQAKQRGIPSLAFLDQWQNYTARFSGRQDDEHLAYMPDFINCIDEIGEMEMLGEGFPNDILVRWGHPYLSTLSETARAMDCVSLKERMGIAPGKQVSLFVSEPILETYGRARGYDQYDALELFLDISQANPKPPFLVVKLHPKDEKKRFVEILNARKDTPFLLLSEDFNSMECLTVSDRVYGMTSIMLIEAYILGKPVVSLQPGLRIQDPLVLSRLGYIPIIRNTNNGRHDPEPVIFASNYHQPGIGFSFHKDAFLDFVEKIAKC